MHRADRIRKVCETGRKYRGTYLSIYFIPSPDDISRAGISVGKRLGNAVKRNRARRLIREALRLSRDSLDRCVWIVCVAKREIGGACFPEVEADLIRLLEQSGACQ